MEQQLMKKGWYSGLASRFSNHYFDDYELGVLIDMLCKAKDHQNG